jgi:serine/threonine-protein kinase
MPTDLRPRLEAALRGAYILERELGGGGMSRVFVAVDQRLGRRIVVKVLAPDVLEGVSLERFEQEIRLAARLQHPNVVPVLAAGDSDGVPYYTMPFVVGESLRARLDAGPAVPTPEAVRLLTDVLRALAYAHAEGVVHRDIKPENVLLSSGVAVVTDFGIAKALQTARAGGAGPDVAGGLPGAGTGPALTRVGTALGTPAYMAPEQAVGEAVDGRADLYAWGMLAYEVLAGGHPFAGRTSTQQMLVAQLTERPAPLAERAPHLPRGLAALVEQCLEKDPAARTATAADALARLEQIQLSGEQAEARRAAPGAGEPAGPAAGGGRRARRTRAFAAAGVAGVLVLGAAAAWARRASAPPLVAVLPFQTQGVPDDSLFAEGLSDAVTQKLAGLSGLRVIDPGSVTSAAENGGPGAERAPQAIGRALGADYVLRTVVRWRSAGAGAHEVRITPALVRVADGTTRWAGEPTIVGSGGDLFRAQAALARQVAEALGVALGAGDRARLERALTTDSVAYAAYLRGQDLAERGILETSVPVVRAALAQFAQATARDPQFADAYARSSTLFGVIYNAGGRPGVLLDSAEQLARRALALEPTNATANSQLAFVLTQRGAAEEARRVMERATAANPSDVGLLRGYAVAARFVGDTAAYRATAEQLVRLAPRSGPSLQAAAAAWVWLRRPGDQADSLYARVLALDPGALPVYIALARRAAARGDTAGVDRWVREFRTRGGRIGPSTFAVLRAGGAALRQEVLTASPDALGAASPSDRDDVNSVRLQLLAARGADVRALADSSLTLVRAQLGEPGLPATARYFLLRYAAKLSAVRGDAAAARRDLATAAADPLVVAYPLGASAVQHHCASAETYGWLGDVPQLVPALRLCLTNPGGNTSAQARALPGIARHAGHPEVAALLTP